MPREEILATFGGADGGLMRYAVDQGAKGIVVQAVGMGNMNVSMFEAVKCPILLQGRASGRLPSEWTTDVIVLYMTSKTATRIAVEAGATMAGDLSPKKRLLMPMTMQH